MHLQHPYTGAEECNSIKQLDKNLQCLHSTGYFLRHFKNAMLVFIPKPNKAIHYPTNISPVSLFEITAKIFEQHKCTATQCQTIPRGTTSAPVIIYKNIASSLKPKSKKAVSPCTQGCFQSI